MSRRRAAEKREAMPDRKYGCTFASKFVNMLMCSGKKLVSESIFYGAVEKASVELGHPPEEILPRVLKKVRPSVEVCSRRVGGATYQIPVEVRPERATSLAMRWLISAALKRGSSSMEKKLSSEFIDALNGRGGSIKCRDDTHKMAESNKAFAHFRW